MRMHMTKKGRKREERKVEEYCLHLDVQSCTLKYCLYAVYPAFCITTIIYYLAYTLHTLTIFAYLLLCSRPLASYIRNHNIMPSLFVVVCPFFLAKICILDMEHRARLCPDTLPVALRMRCRSPLVPYPLSTSKACYTYLWPEADEFQSTAVHCQEWREFTISFSCVRYWRRFEGC